MEKRQTSLCAAPCRDAGKRLACPGARVRGMPEDQRPCVCLCVWGGLGGLGLWQRRSNFFFFSSFSKPRCRILDSRSSTWFNARCHLSGFEMRFQPNWAYVVLAEMGPADKEQLRSAVTTGNDEQAHMSEVNDSMSKESDSDLWR